MGKVGFYVRQFENPLDGETMYCARQATYSELSAKEMIEAAARNQRVDAQQMEIGLSALSDAIMNFVLNGHSVTLDGLGCFSISCKTGIWDDRTKKWKSAGRTSMSDVSPNDIKGVFVRFAPCTELRNKMKATELINLTNTKFMADKGGYLIDPETGKAKAKTTTGSNG